MEVCRFFQQGRCAFGTACRLVHVQPGAPAQSSAPPPPPAARGSATSTSTGASGSSSSGGAPPPYAAYEEEVDYPWPEEASRGGSSSTAASASTAAPPCDAEKEAEVKELRKVQKALREIEALVARRDAGEGMQVNQLKKIEKRSECERNIRELEDSIALREAMPPPPPPPAPPRPTQQRAVDSPPAKRAPVGPPQGPICRHFLTGRCAYGNACRLSHAVDGAQSEEQRRPYQLEPSFDVEDPECGICFESIRKKGERFGILENCDHAFCLTCIRSWRKQREQQDRQNLRLCPVCRNESFFVVPSDVVFVDPDKKKSVIDAYKVEMARIPCKLFDYGRGKCAFGNSCFYVHLNPDGTRFVPAPLHWRNGADGSEVQADVKLSDFLAHSLSLP
mmetsp:Transcript_174667/g.560139  ORF Transcript_174667/g.560139 Transcript_174667/m.560139 type:complete len:392 (-) Transcript_174667:172-1347(-)